MSVDNGAEFSEDGVKSPEPKGFVVLRPVERTFGFAGEVGIKNVQPGVDLQISRFGEGYWVEVSTNPEFPTARPSYAGEAGLGYRGDGRLVRYESDQFFGISNDEFLDTAAKVVTDEEARHILETDANSERLIKGLTDEQQDELNKRIGAALDNLAEERKEPRIMFNRTKSGGWHVYVTNRPSGEFELKAGRESVGKIVEEGDEVAIRWKGRRLVYGVKEARFGEKATDVAMKVFYVREEAPVMNAQGFGTVSFTREVAVPDQIDVKKMTRAMAPKGPYKQIREWFPLWVKKPV